MERDLLLAAVEQFQDRYVFLMPQGYATNFVTVVAPMDAQVTLDGAPVTGFESDKVRALLAYLAVESDRPHRRETLAGLLWPEQPENAARLSLRQTQREDKRARRTLAEYLWKSYQLENRVKTLALSPVQPIDSDQAPPVHVPSPSEELEKLR